MGRREPCAAAAAEILLQDAIDASEVIGRWEYDVPNDRVYADALVALVFNLNPELAKAGAPLSAFMDGVHSDDRERVVRLIAKSAENGLPCAIEYRVCSADGVTRWVLDRGRIAQDGAGRPAHGSGILVDITQTKHDETAYFSGLAPARPAPLERAAEHCLAAREAIQELPQSVLHQMSDMMLLEIGLRLSEVADSRRSGTAV